MTKHRTKIVLVAGARPNFMKVAPIIRELRKHEAMIDWRLVHTGQHYDDGMSDVFFRELGIPKPHFHMGAGGGSHATQTARIMVSFEEYCLGVKPDLVCVVGDVDSTLACSIVAKKSKCKVAHVEAGLRSNDRFMPEEINRIVTDSISDLLFVTEESGVENLLREGHPSSAVHFVGHVMIDNLLYQLERLGEVDSSTLKTSQIKRALSRYGVVTLHRPSNVDDEKSLSQIMGALSELSKELPLIFPIHPRTHKNIEKYSISIPDSIIRIEPLSYMEFLNLWKDAAIVLTDSGGLQEETTGIGVPCITLRENTERPVTLSEGTNCLAGTDPVAIKLAAKRTLSVREKIAPRRPQFWDGRAAERIVAVLREC